MKRQNYFFIVASLLLVACTDVPSYTITGTTPEHMPDGHYAYLRESNFDTVIDSALVQNHQFSFKGSQNTPESCFITYQPGKKIFYAAFYLENANLQVKLGEKVSSVSGSPLNEKATAFRIPLEKNLNLMKEAKRAVRNESLSEEERKHAEDKLKELLQQQKELIMKTISENNANIFGLSLLANSWDYLDPSEILELINEIPENSKDEKIKKLEEKVKFSTKTAVGAPFIDFTMKDLEGKEVKLGDYIARNKYTLVDFWASWCGPCRAEMPKIVSVYQKYNKQGFGIVSVSLDKEESKWKKAVQDLKMDWDHMSDLKGWDCQGAKQYGINSIPATVLIGQDGKIVAKNLLGKELDSKLNKLLKQEK